MHSLQRFLNPLDVVSAYERFSFYEIISGMRPFQLIFSQKGLLKMAFSPIGFIFACLHLMAFGYSCTIVMISEEQPVTIFMDDMLAYTQTVLMQWVQCLNTLLIFVCNFVYYDRDLKMLSKLQLVNNQMETLGFDMPTFYRQAVRSLFAVFVLVIVILVGLFVQGMYFYSRVVEEQYLICYGIMYVMPTVYIQVQLVQFIILSTFQIVLSRQMNAILLEVLRGTVDDDGTDTE